MEQRNSVPYFVNTPPPNISKQKEYNPMTRLRDGSNSMAPTQIRHMIERDTGQPYEKARASNLSSNVDFSRPPPVSQIPNRTYQSDCFKSAEVTKPPTIKSEYTGSMLETSPSRPPQQNGNIRPPQRVSSQQSSGPQSSSGSLGPPHPTNAHQFRLTQTGDMHFMKTKPPLTGVRPPPIPPPIPAGPPPSSTPPPPPPPGPPPPGPSPTGPPTEANRQLRKPPPMMQQLQAPSRGEDQQIHSSHVMLGPPLQQKQQPQTPLFDVEQQMQTPPPGFVTPPGQPTYYAPPAPIVFALRSCYMDGLFKVPPPVVVQGSPPNAYYIQESTYANQQNSNYNHYKRNRVSDNLDPELRRGSKKKKKSLALILPQRKGWSVEDARKAIEIERECSKGTRKYSLFIKFPDPELNREIVSSFHSAIESVHFQQPSTPRFCFVNISSSADPEAVRQELNKVQFGGGYLSAEFKKDREDDFNINPEDIDPTTLYVGNLAQEVTKDDMLRMYPKNKRIDIGYAKKMKFTRYAFVAFKCAADAIQSYKTTHDTQMYNKSLIVRFRRMNGTIGMLGEPKMQSKTEKDHSQSKSSETNDQVPSEENENETVDNSIWDIDVSTWQRNYDEMYDSVDDEDMLDVKPCFEDLENDVKVERKYIDQFLQRNADLGDFTRQKNSDGASNDGCDFSHDESRTSNAELALRLEENRNDIFQSSSNSEVDNSDPNNSATVKHEIKSEVDQNRDNNSLRSTYRQLMLTRRRKNMAIKVEEGSNTVVAGSGKSEPSNPENENTCSQTEGDLIRVSPPKNPDRDKSPIDLDDSSFIAKESPEVIEEIKKDIKEESSSLSTKRCSSTYADLREIGRKMKIASRLKVKEETGSVSYALKDDEMLAIDAHEADTIPDTGASDQARQGPNVQHSEFSRSDDNWTNPMESSQINKTQCSSSRLESDSVAETSARQNEASEQENDEFNFDVDLNTLGTEIKKEPSGKDDSENDAYLDGDDDDDDDIADFLRRRKAHT